jgi:hypothetical protein
MRRRTDAGGREKFLRDFLSLENHTFAPVSAPFRFVFDPASVVRRAFSRYPRDRNSKNAPFGRKERVPA